MKEEGDGAVRKGASRFRGTLDTFARSQHLEDALPFLRELASGRGEGGRSLWKTLHTLVVPHLVADHRHWARRKRRTRDLGAYLETVRLLALFAMEAGDGEILALARRHWADAALEIPEREDRFKAAVAYLRQDPHSMRAAFLACSEAEALGKKALARKFGDYVDSLYTVQRVRGARALMGSSSSER